MPLVAPALRTVWSTTTEPPDEVTAWSMPPPAPVPVLPVRVVLVPAAATVEEEDEDEEVGAAQEKRVRVSDGDEEEVEDAVDPVSGEMVGLWGDWVGEVERLDEFEASFDAAASLVMPSAFRGVSFGA